MTNNYFKIIVPNERSGLFVFFDDSSPTAGIEAYSAALKIAERRGGVLAIWRRSTQFPPDTWVIDESERLSPSGSRFARENWKPLPVRDRLDARDVDPLADTPRQKDN